MEHDLGKVRGYILLLSIPEKGIDPQKEHANESSALIHETFCGMLIWILRFKKIYVFPTVSVMNKTWLKWLILCYVDLLNSMIYMYLRNITKKNKLCVTPKRKV